MLAGVGTTLLVGKMEYLRTEDVFPKYFSVAALSTVQGHLFRIQSTAPSQNLRPALGGFRLIRTILASLGHSELKPRIVVTVQLCKTQSQEGW